METISRVSTLQTAVNALSRVQSTVAEVSLVVQQVSATSRTKTSISLASALLIEEV